MMHLLQGDCLEVMKLIPDGTIDCIIADLPYNITSCDWDQDVINLEILWSEFHRIAKSPRTPMIMFSAQPFTTRLTASNIKNRRHGWYWVKSKASGYILAKRQPMKQVEDITIFASKGVDYHPPLELREKPYTEKRTGRKKSQLYGGGNFQTTGDAITYTHKMPTDVLYCPSVKDKERLQNTQKPVDLLKFLIATYTNPGDVILDPTMGSGSTGVAALALDRHFVGIEKKPLHYEIAYNRLHGLPITRRAVFDPAPHRHFDPLLRDIMRNSYQALLDARATLSMQEIHKVVCANTNIDCKFLAFRNHLYALARENGDYEKFAA